MSAPEAPTAIGDPLEPAVREAVRGYPRFPDLLPEDSVAGGRYVVRFARTSDDLDAIERLRFEVFNLELGEGLDSAFVTGRDHDDLDLLFHHLLITVEGSGEVVGTYRLQTGEMAAAGRGFYSAGEFDLSGLPPEFISSAVEVGRACVARGHRNGRVLQLLWRGLAGYLTRNHKRHVFGCCSLTSQDPALGLATRALLEQQGHRHADLDTPPLPGLECTGAEAADVALLDPHIPRLFQSYLNLGAKVCGAPAIDRTFKTIDFLVALDVTRLHPHAYQYFFR